MGKGPKMANICVFEEVKESFMDRVQTVRVSDGRRDGSCGQGNVVGGHCTLRQVQWCCDTMLRNNKSTVDFPTDTRSLMFRLSTRICPKEPPSTDSGPGEFL